MTGVLDNGMNGSRLDRKDSKLKSLTITGKVIDDSRAIGF